MCFVVARTLPLFPPQRLGPRAVGQPGFGVSCSVVHILGTPCRGLMAAAVVSLPFLHLRGR